VLCSGSIVNRKSQIVNERAFTLVEILMTMVLLSLIVLALMSVFNSTQKAFRASLTQTDVLESGRLAMGLMVGDLEGMTPSLKTINTNISTWYLPGNDPYNTNNNVNFYAAVTTFASPPTPLYQSLVGVTDPNTMRTNLLESFFSLSRQIINGSPNWVGTGYAVSTNSPDGALYPLYRFYMATNTTTGTPASLYNAFMTNSLTSSPPWSHLMDGAVALRVRPYDPNGLEMTNTYEYNYNRSVYTFTNHNAEFFLQSVPGVYGCYMYSNTVPAAVEVELGVLEDTVLQRAESFNGNMLAQTNYLVQHAGQVHLFRQRVQIRNVDPTAYQ
jgi:prepilin-type N-terminal cleavage/methylation domain-containing protein